MFEVSVGEETHNFGTRAEAIVAARDFSSEFRGVVNIVDDGERERMTYQGGELVSYEYETRRRRR